MGDLRIYREGTPPTFSSLPCHPVSWRFSQSSSFSVKFSTGSCSSFLHKLSFSPGRFPPACVGLLQHLTSAVLIICALTPFQQPQSYVMIILQFFTRHRSLHADCLALWLRPPGYVLIQNLLFLSISQHITCTYNPAISGLKSFRSLCELQVQVQYPSPPACDFLPFPASFSTIL